MSVEIVEIYKQSAPAVRFIGKRYYSNENYGAKWGEWHANGWFDVLEGIGANALNDDGYIAIKRINNCELEYWIGMFFDCETAVPDGFEFVDIEAVDYAVFWLKGENEQELVSFETHNLCLSKLEDSGFVRREDDWCFERYNCPRYTDPDENGCVILDYGISVL